MNIMEMFPEVKFYVSKVSFLLISSQYLIYSVNQGYYLLGVSLPGTIHKRLKGIDRQCMVVQLRIQNKNKKNIKFLHKSTFSVHLTYIVGHIINL